MSRSLSRLSSSRIVVVAASGTTVPAHAQSWAENWLDNVTYTSPGSFEDQTRRYLTAGGMSGRVDVHNDYLMSLRLPKVKAGGGGIAMFLGGMSFLAPGSLVPTLARTMKAWPASPFPHTPETTSNNN